LGAGGGGFPDFGMAFGNPGFVAYATAFGIKGSRVESADDLAPALETAFAGGGVHLVSMPIDYSETIGVLITESRAHASKSGEK
jgi:acetolactate synthase-1/2/3 large subunit